MSGGIKGQCDCIKQSSEVDFTDDLRKMSIPTLLLHGDADQIVPIADAAERAVKILAAKVNADLLAFANS